jgi:hypothetical protein
LWAGATSRPRSREILSTRTSRKSSGRGETWPPGWSWTPGANFVP